jgi:hypothetical protein
MSRRFRGNLAAYDESSGTVSLNATIACCQNLLYFASFGIIIAKTIEY